LLQSFFRNYRPLKTARETRVLLNVGFGTLTGRVGGLETLHRFVGSEMVE